MEEEDVEEVWEDIELAEESLSRRLFRRRRVCVCSCCSRWYKGFRRSPARRLSSSKRIGVVAVVVMVEELCCIIVMANSDVWKNSVLACFSFLNVKEVQAPKNNHYPEIIPRGFCSPSLS